MGFDYDTQTWSRIVLSSTTYEKVLERAVAVIFYFDDPSRLMEEIMLFPKTASRHLKSLNELLTSLRDEKSAEFKALYATEGVRSAEDHTYYLEFLLCFFKHFQFMRTVAEDTNRYHEDIYRSHVYPYFYLILDNLNVLVHRHLKYVTQFYKNSSKMEGFYSEDDSRMVISNFQETMKGRGPITENFGDNQQELKKGISNLLMVNQDNECTICHKKITTDSDFALLTSCTHLMCADCAEVEFMAEVSSSSTDEHGAVKVELGKTPRCRCGLEVVAWTTTHLMKACLKQ